MTTGSAPRALISGASVAGPTAACWLAKAGWDVTVVERANSVRVGGYPIDIRGSAIEVTRRMNIDEHLRASAISSRAVNFVGQHGRTFATADLSQLIAQVNSQDIELPRGCLTRVLYEQTRDDVEYIFGDSIATLDQDEAGVDVEFVSGKQQRFDVVLGADGIHSRTRTLAFGPEPDFIKHLGYCVAIFELHDDLGIGRQNFMYNVPGRTIGVGRLADGAAQAFLAFKTSAPECIDVEDLKSVDELVKAAYRPDGWKVSEIVAQLQVAPDLYFDTVSQIHMPRWNSGRIAVIGDAAFAPAFLSGQGTSLAIMGAYVVAQQLTASTDHSDALRAYDRIFRSLAGPNQALALRSGGFVLPKTRRALYARNAVLVALPLLQQMHILDFLNRRVQKASNRFPLDE